MDIKKWFQAQVTTKQIYEGFFPVAIIQASAWVKEDEENKTQREVITLVFETLQEVGFPDGSSDKIVASQNLYFDVPMHRNSLNKVAHSCGLSKFTSTEDFEGKVCMAGLVNNTYERDGETRYVAQCGYGLFSFAPHSPGAQVKFLLTDFPPEQYEIITDEMRKEWFKRTTQNFMPPR